MQEETVLKKIGWVLIGIVIHIGIIIVGTTAVVIMFSGGLSVFELGGETMAWVGLFIIFIVFFGVWIWEAEARRR